MQVPFGVIQTKDHIIKSIVEKPIREFCINAGIYVLNPSLINYIDGCKFLSMPDFLNEKIKMGAPVNAFPIYVSTPI